MIITNNCLSWQLTANIKIEEYLKSLEEESIRDNFVTVYELLDEMMDNGVP